MAQDLLRSVYSGKSVWLSGDTGFKGAWLAAWLLELGAEVHGFALEPPTSPSLYDQLGLVDRIQHDHAANGGKPETAIRRAAAAGLRPAIALGGVHAVGHIVRGRAYRPGHRVSRES